MIDMFDFFDIKTEAELLSFVAEIESIGYKLHHESWVAGYVSRKLTAKITPYDGLFGTGLILHIPCRISTQYHVGYYYIL